MRIEYDYMSGAGNLFTVVDNRHLKISIADAMDLAPILCNNQREMRTEGLMLLESSETHDFNVQFFNPDGSYGAMCGNGSRCAVKFAIEKGFTTFKESYKFLMAGKEYLATISNDLISVQFLAPIEINHTLHLSIEGMDFECSYVNVGSDHVVFDGDIVRRQFESRGLNFVEDVFFFEARNHRLLQPRGANVNLFSHEEGIVRLKTFERGVEAITGACGTGAISTAIHCWHCGLTGKSVVLLPPSNEIVRVEIETDENNFVSAVFLEGNARFLYNGFLEVSRI